MLNACQSAQLDQNADNPYATVATALLQSGMRSVVAMAYSLYVSGAQVFLPEFYRRLFETGSIAEAVRAGRQQMVANKNRISPRGPFPLDDWLLPVLYQQAPLDLPFAAAAKPEERISRLPDEVINYRDDYGFIGRDGPMLDMERALQRKAPCILIQGLGGVGKTTLARGFLRWLDETDGLYASLWFDFRDIRSSEFVINRIGQLFYGENFGVAKDKLHQLAKAFREYRAVLVWDNFESATQNLPAEDRSQLALFLEAIHGTQGKVVITSRSTEDWIQPSLRCELALSGLNGEERWEYCEVILRELGLGSKINRDDPALVQLMDQLAGHPLAMRVVLPKLERMPASKIAEALRNNIAGLGLHQDEEQGRLFATLRFVEQGLPEDLRPLLSLVGLHEAYVTADLMEAMAKKIDSTWNRPKIDRLMAELTNEGLLKCAWQTTYQMHPLLTSYLLSQNPASREPEKRAFVDVMGLVAAELAHCDPHGKRLPFLFHGPNLRFALALAWELSMETQIGALTQSLASRAQGLRNFVEAARLYEDLVEREKVSEDWDRKASACHQLGIIAQEQRQFETARKWYLKSLDIKEQRGNLHGAAITYRQLGAVTEEQRDFGAASEWCSKSLAIDEAEGNFQGTAINHHQLGLIAEGQRHFETAREAYLTSLAISEKHGFLDTASLSYHQLGILAQGQRDLDEASGWYLKSLAISERQGNLHAAASSYHQLGTLAEEQRNFETARGWHLKSLAISERQGNLHLASFTYHQMGRIAEEQGDSKTAHGWYLKSLAISERQGNMIAAAGTRGQIGILEGRRGDLKSCAECLTWAVRTFLKAADLHSAQNNVGSLLFFYGQASQAEKLLVEAVWKDAEIGPFPTLRTP